MAVVRVEAGSHTQPVEKARRNLKLTGIGPNQRRGKEGGAGKSNDSSALAKLASLLVHAATRRLGIIVRLNCRWNSGRRPRC